mgnify:CR=1 FL=1
MSPHELVKLESAWRRKQTEWRIDRIVAVATREPDLTASQLAERFGETCDYILTTLRRRGVKPAPAAEYFTELKPNMARVVTFSAWTATRWRGP